MPCYDACSVHHADMQGVLWRLTFRALTLLIQQDVLPYGQVLCLRDTYYSSYILTLETTAESDAACIPPFNPELRARLLWQRQLPAHP